LLSIGPVTAAATTGTTDSPRYTGCPVSVPVTGRCSCATVTFLVNLENNTHLDVADEGVTSPRNDEVDNVIQLQQI
jgi:hypothetical protein